MSENTALDTTALVLALDAELRSARQRDLEQCAEIRHLRAAVGPDKVTVDREVLAILLDQIRETVLQEPLPDVYRAVQFWREDLDVIADAVAALSEPPEETP
jgi:hypothetical protein